MPCHAMAAIQHGKQKAAAPHHAPWGYVPPSRQNDASSLGTYWSHGALLAGFIVAGWCAPELV